jgi:hypothetical protein
MALYTLRPNDNWRNAGLFTATGGSAHAVLADDDDTTFLLRTSTTVPASYETEFTTVSLSANEIVTSVNLRAEISSLAADSLAQFSIGVITDRNGRTVNYSIPVSKQGIRAASIVDSGLKLTSAPNGAPWNQTLIDNLVAKFTDGATGSTVLPPDPTNRTTLFELFIDVETAPRPTLTVTAPTGTVTTTSFPEVVWSPVFSGVEKQNAYEIKIFDAATYNASGFSPDTSTPLIGTGIVFDSVDGQTLEGDLANNTTYRAFVRVASLVNGANFFSAFAFSEFSLNIDSPATPTVSAFFNSNIDAVSITVFGRTNAMTANQASLETNATGWEAVTNCSISRSTSQFSNGIASLALLSAAAGDMTAATTAATKFAVTANNKFSATAEFRADTTPRLCSAGIIFLNAAGSTISTVFGTAGNNSSSGWTKFDVVATAPALATHARVVVKIASAGSAETHYVDKIAFHAGDNPFWTRGGFENFTFVVERSDDLAVTFTPVRNSPAVASLSQIAIINDFEVPFDKVVFYRAKARAEIS